VNRPPLLNQRPVTVAVAVLAPLAVSSVVVPFREDVANTNVALLQVLVIMVVATSGDRVAGAVAALSAAASFDFFLTRPYERLAVTDRSDVETTLLLLAVGVGVTEIAAWGYRHRATSAQAAGYLAGIRTAADAVAVGSSASELIGTVSSQLVRVLGLRSCRFEYGVAGLGKPALLRDDGQVAYRGTVWDVEHDGLPVQTDIELLVESKGRLQGRFMLSAAPGSHPSVPQRLVAVTLADQVGASLR
jgi:K+-sensing histidine kinase KdpD